MEGQLLQPHAAIALGDMLINEASAKEDMAFVSALKLTPYPDGNKWCVLWGENIQEGIVGFGDTPIMAIRDFNNSMYKQKLTPNPQSNG